MGHDKVVANARSFKISNISNETISNRNAINGDHSLCEICGCDAGKPEFQEKVMTTVVAKLNAELSKARETIKEMAASSKETQWALTAEVAEKHDQVVELRRCMTALEEQLRQADKQTHFKDDIIKTLRIELKEAKACPRGSKTPSSIGSVALSQERSVQTDVLEHRNANTQHSVSPVTQLVDKCCHLRGTKWREGPKLCDVVTEATLHHRLQEEGMSVNTTPSAEQTPRAMVAALKSALKSGMQEISEQEKVNLDLETDLYETRRDVAALAASDNSNGNKICDYASIADLAKCLEKSISTISNLSTESGKTEIIRKEEDRLKFVKQRLEVLSIGGGGDAGTVVNTCHQAVPLLREMKGDLRCLKDLSKRHHVEISAGCDDPCYGKWDKFEDGFTEMERHVLHLVDSSRTEDGSSVKCICLYDVQKEGLATQVAEKEAYIERLTREINELKSAYDNPGIIDTWIKKNLTPLLETTGAIIEELGHYDHEIVNSKNIVSCINKRINFLKGAIATLPMLKDKLAAQERLVSNKEETLRQLHSNVEMRERQVLEFNQKVKELEKQLEEQRQVIADLQLAVQNCKKFEVKPKENEICSLQFELCELDLKRKISEKERDSTDEALDRVCNDNFSLKRKVNDLEMELCTFKPDLEKTQRRCVHFQEISLKLRKELEERDYEIKDLQKEVLRLETELASEVERSEERALQDSVVIAGLRDKVERLQNQSRALWRQHDEIIAVAEGKLKEEREKAYDQGKQLAIQNHRFSSTIQQLAYENRILTDQVGNSKCQEEIRSKVNNLEYLLRQGEERQMAYDRQIAELRRLLKENGEKYFADRNELMRKLSEAEEGIAKKEDMLLKMKNTMIKKEDELVRLLQKSRAETEALRREKVELEHTMEEKLAAFENREAAELNELENIVRKINHQKMELGSKCGVLTEELKRREEGIRVLEEKIAEITAGGMEKIARLNEKCATLTNRCEVAEGNERHLRGNLAALKEEGLAKLKKEEEGRRSAEKELSKAREELEDVRGNLMQVQRKLTNFEKLKKDYEDLNGNHGKVLEELKLSERKKSNIEKLLITAEEELNITMEAKVAIETDLCQMKEDKALLQEKVASLSRSRNKDLQKLSQETIVLSEKNKTFLKQLEEAYNKIREYETQVIPELSSSLDTHHRIVEALKTDLDNANDSCLRIRKEAFNLVDLTRKHLIGQSGRVSSAGDAKHLREDHVQALANMSDRLLSEIHEIQRDGSAAGTPTAKKKTRRTADDRRSYSPSQGPNVWAKSACARPQWEQRDSPECFLESGFHSLVQSPTNMMYDVYQPELDEHLAVR